MCLLGGILLAFLLTCLPLQTVSGDVLEVREYIILPLIHHFLPPTEASVLNIM